MDDLITIEDEVEVNSETECQKSTTELCQMWSSFLNKACELALDKLNTRQPAVQSKPTLIRKRKSPNAAVPSSSSHSGQNEKRSKLEETPEETSFRLSEIRNKIFNHLDFPDLKILRLVSSSWNSFATLEILQRDMTALTFDYNKNTNTYINPRQDYSPSVTLSDPLLLLQQQLPPQPQRSSRTLAQLTTLLKKSKIFPCSDYTINGGSLNTTDTKNFFKFHGHKIRSLKLDQGEAVTEVTLRRILSRQTPNLENLTVATWRCTKRWKEPRQFSLPSLKTITNDRWAKSFHMSIGNGWPLVFAMLANGLPKLETVHGFQCSAIDLILMSNKLNTVKEYRFEAGLEVNPIELSKFASAGPKLQFLCFRHSETWKNKILKPVQQQIGRTIYEALNQILESSKDTLKSLSIDSLGSVEIGGSDLASCPVRFPVLENLTHLSLLRDRCVTGESVSRMFPKGLNFCQTFPNVQSLHLTLNMHSVESWDSSFPSSESQGLGSEVISSVKTLSIAPLTGCSSFWTQKFSSIFSVRKIILKHSCYSSTLKDVCRLHPELEELELFLRYEDCDSSGMRNLEYSITGIPEWVWNIQFFAENSSQDPNVRDKPSVSDLKNLKKFRLTVTTPDTNSNNPENYKHDFQLISWISVVYGFQKIPGLKVEIAFNHKNPSAPKVAASLESVAPFVTFVHHVLPFEEWLGM